MGRIEKLLAADEANTKVTPKLIDNLHPWALAAFEDTASLYRLLYNLLGDWPTENAVDTDLRKLAEENNLTPEDLMKRLDAGQADDIKKAQPTSGSDFGHLEL